MCTNDKKLSKSQSVFTVQELDSVIPNEGNALIIKVKLGVKPSSC